MMTILKNYKVEREHKYQIEVTESKNNYVVCIGEENGESIGFSYPKMVINRYLYQNEMPMTDAQKVVCNMAIERFENRKSNKEAAELKQYLRSIGQIEIKEVRVKNVHGGSIYRHMEGTRIIERIIHHN